MRVSFESPEVEFALPEEPVPLVANTIQHVGDASNFKVEKDGSLSADLDLFDIKSADLKGATFVLSVFAERVTALSVNPRD